MGTSHPGRATVFAIERRREVRAGESGQKQPLGVIAA